MISSNKQSIEDLIVELLANNPYSKGVSLVELIQKSRSKTVKQSVYTALSSLLESEVVSKIGGKYFLSRLWLNKIDKLFQSKQQDSNDTIFKLKEGESISYYFPSLLTCDTYWAHVFSLLINWIPENRPIVVWNPHEWFMIGRKEEEAALFAEFKTKHKHAFYPVPGKTPLDQEFRKNWSSENVSITTGSNVKLPTNYYLNVFDNLIIEVYIDEKLETKIEEFYQRHQKTTPENITEFKSLISEKYKVRMKISRNSKKASLLQKKLLKEFYVPQHLAI